MEILVFEGGKKDKLEIMCDFKQPILFQIDIKNENNYFSIPFNYVFSL
jgi:hypothetical protein